MIYGGLKTGILPSSTIMSLILFAIPVIFLLIQKPKILDILRGIV